MREIRANALLNHYIVDIKKEKQLKMIGEEKPTTFPLNVNDYKRKVKLALEKYYISKYRRGGKLLYNVTDGGDGIIGDKVTDKITTYWNGKSE